MVSVGSGAGALVRVVEPYAIRAFIIDLIAAGPTRRRKLERPGHTPAV